MGRSWPWQASAEAGDTGTTRFAEAIRTAGVGAWDWYVDSGLLMLDKPAMALLGIDPETYDGFIRTWTSLIHPDDYPRVAEETRRAMLTLGPFGQEYRVCRRQSATQLIQVRGRVLGDADGRPYRMLGAMWDATRSWEASDGPEADQGAGLGAAERAARIQNLATALAEAVTAADVATAVADWLLPPFGAKGLIIGVSEDGMNRVIGSVGAPQAHIDAVTAPVEELPQVAEAMRTHTPWFISSPQEYVQRYPTMARMPALGGNQAWAFLPLVVSWSACA